ncbi:MAG: 2-amino-4-hydroxy-6-hydroxymethyldihydropteridine diphosphokinase [Candidatus Hydrogenedentes bacterium]|nr:2-amino-4-hydroxy-6-hydroxymethyldihydropteridine diphosphokinase [Candidatus Hydrogenedentota bacterium]
MPPLADAYISIGSNIEPESNILRALRLLATSQRLTAVSTMYRSAALNRPDQPDFINGVCAIETALAPRALKFDCLRPIEEQLGRVRTADKYARRTIDLDIALYADQQICDDDLMVPDPDIRTRPFLAVPLIELAPGLMLPGTGQPLADVVRGMDRSAIAADPAFTKYLRERLSL